MVIKKFIAAACVLLVLACNNSTNVVTTLDTGTVRKDSAVVAIPQPAPDTHRKNIPDTLVRPQ